MPFFHSKSAQKMIPLHTLEREMAIAGIMWLIFGGICVVAANAWAAGL